MEMVDKTGMPRSPEDFAEARRVVEKRLVRKLPTTVDDIELFLQLSTIRDALQVCESLSSALKAKIPLK